MYIHEIVADDARSAVAMVGACAHVRASRVLVATAAALAALIVVGSGCAGDAGGDGASDAGTDAPDADASPELPTYDPAEHDGPTPGAGELGGPRTDLTDEELAAFDAGREMFMREFTHEDGLGPYWEETSCAACHFVPVIGGTGGARLVVVSPGPPPYFEAEHHPPYALDGYPPRLAPETATHSRPRPLFGLGLIAAVPDEVIVAGCDAEDRDGDGVMGRPALYEQSPGGLRLFRFGSKAHELTVAGFSQNAMFDDFNITSGPDGGPLDDFFGMDDDAVPDPEVFVDVVELLDAYVRGLAPPARAGDHPEGEAVFHDIGCATCHRPDLGPQAPGAYTDLCIHDMGEVLDNGIADRAAGPSDYRTPPLWGLRFQTLLLHDGSASSPEQAIERHGGEAAPARDAFLALDEADREALLGFLDTL